MCEASLIAFDLELKYTWLVLLNKARADEYMRRCRLDALIATSPTNVTYFTDYHCWIDYLFKEYMRTPGAASNMGQVYALCPLGGDPALVVKASYAVNAANLWVKDINTFGDPGFDTSLQPGTVPLRLERLYDAVTTPQENSTAMDALLSVIKARGLSRSRIGVELEGVPDDVQETIVNALPGAKILDCTNLIRLVRMVKSSEEIRRLKRSAEINELCGLESLSIVESGISVHEIAQYYRSSVADMGADFDHFAFGMRGIGMFTEADYILRDDDVLFADFGCIYRHYFSDSGTTLALQELPDALMERFTTVRSCIAAGAAAAKVGARASEAHHAMIQALQDCGLEASSPHGHGVGLEVRDYPIVVANNGLYIKDECLETSSDLQMESDMMINLEANIYVPGVASVHTEQSFLVAQAGAEPLLTQEREHPIQAGRI